MEPDFDLKTFIRKHKWLVAIALISVFIGFYLSAVWAISVSLMMSKSVSFTDKGVLGAFVIWNTPRILRVVIWIVLFSIIVGCFSGCSLFGYSRLWIATLYHNKVLQQVDYLIARQETNKALEFCLHVIQIDEKYLRKEGQRLVYLEKLAEIYKSAGDHINYADVEERIKAIQDKGTKPVSFSSILPLPCQVWPILLLVIVDLLGNLGIIAWLLPSPYYFISLAIAAIAFMIGAMLSFVLCFLAP